MGHLRSGLITTYRNLLRDLNPLGSALILK